MPYDTDTMSWSSRADAEAAMIRADRPADLCWTDFESGAGGGSDDAAPKGAWWCVVATDGAHEVYLAPVEAGVAEPWGPAGPGLVWAEL